VEASCFDGIYVTGDITPEYLDALESHRHKSNGKSSEDVVRTQLNLNPPVAAE
jgi:amidophosphoribosyltransferase